MASSVAAPLERQFGQIPGVTQMTSMSALGAHVDHDPVRPQSQHRFRGARRSGGDHRCQQDAAAELTTPPNYRKVNPADSPIMMLSAQSETLPLITVDDYVENFLAQQLSQVPGVAQASIGGEQKTSIRIQVDPAKLASSGLTLEDIRSMLVNATTNAAKGTVNTARNELHDRRERPDHRSRAIQ